MGFCFGSWAIWHVQTQPGFISGVNFHPSVQLEQYLWQASQQELVQRLLTPQLVLTAAADEVNMKEGGELINILRNKVYFYRFLLFKFLNFLFFFNFNLFLGIWKIC